MHPKASVRVLQSPEPAAPVQQADIPRLVQKADTGDRKAKLQLARWYWEASQVKRAASLVKDLAESGNAEAQFLYALSNQKPEQSIDDHAVSWLERAARGNHIPAMRHLADLYLQDKSKKESISLLRKAASLGDAESAHRLGKLFFEGNEVSHDGVAAYTWLYLARHGFTVPYVDPEFERGTQKTGSHSPLDFLAWTMNLQEVSQAESALAAWPDKLPPEAPLHKYPSWAVARQDLRHLSIALTDQEIAELKRKSDSGDLDAMAELGRMYLGGLGVHPNPVMGMDLINKAADKGHVPALLRLAAIYRNDNDQVTGAAQARKIYEPLAAKGMTEAQVSLAELLFQRDLFPDVSDEEWKANRHAAVRWLGKASRAGNVLAMEYLGNLAFEQKEINKAAVWYQAAAALGSKSALLGRFEIACDFLDLRDRCTWFFIWTSIEPPSARLPQRQMIIELSEYLPEDLVLVYKNYAALWLKENPKALDRTWLRPVDDVNFSDTEGFSALHRAAVEGNKQEVARLIAAKAAINSMDHNGYTPLHVALMARHFDVAKLLVDAGAACNATSSVGITPLDLAVVENDENMVAYLIRAGGNPALQSCLLTAIFVNNPAIARMLVKAGDDVNAVEPSSGKSLVHLSVPRGKKDILNILLQNGADPNIRDKQGNSPLHDAARENNPEAITLLLAAKADASARNNAGKTAFDLANGDEAAKLLETAGEKRVGAQ